MGVCDHDRAGVGAVLPCQASTAQAAHLKVDVAQAKSRRQRHPPGPDSRIHRTLHECSTNRQGRLRAGGRECAAASAVGSGCVGRWSNAVNAPEGVTVRHLLPAIHCRRPQVIQLKLTERRQCQAMQTAGV